MRSDTQHQTDTLSQVSFAELLFSPVPEQAPELPLSAIGLPSTSLVRADAVSDLGAAYALPDRETWHVGEEKERGKWSRSKPETEAERTARIEAQRNKANETHEKVETGLQALAASLAEGKSDTLLTFLNSLARFHRYSWGNTLLIELQRPDATLVAGFSTWKELDRHVTAGEKGIVILAPLVKRARGEAEKEAGRFLTAPRTAYTRRERQNCG